MSSVAAGVALAALASVLFNVAIVIQAREAREVPQEHGVQLSLIWRLLRRPRWLLGTALGLMAFPLQTIALLWAPLTAVQPADAAGLLVLLFLGTRLLHERVGRREVIAVVSIIVGIVILTIAAPKREVTHVEGAGVPPRSRRSSSPSSCSSRWRSPCSSWGRIGSALRSSGSSRRSRSWRAGRSRWRARRLSRGCWGRPAPDPRRDRDRGRGAPV